MENCKWKFFESKNLKQCYLVDILFKKRTIDPVKNIETAQQYDSQRQRNDIKWPLRTTPNSPFLFLIYYSWFMYFEKFFTEYVLYMSHSLPTIKL